MALPLLTSWPMLAQGAVSDEETFITEFRNLPEGWIAVLGAVFLAVMLWTVVWMYRREGRAGASLRVRTLLAGLRCGVLVSLAFVFLDPVQVRIIRQWVESYTVVLVDNSSSMDLVDTYRESADADRVRAVVGVESRPIRRRALVQRLLEQDNRDFLRKLAGNNRVELYTFSKGTERRTTVHPQRRNGGTLDVGNVPLDFPATGSATNVDRAVRRALEAHHGEPLAALVIFSDGGFNAGGPVEDTARFARKRGVPIHVVGIGDPSSPRNIRVAEVLAPANVFKQDPFVISARLVSQGFEGQSVPVFLGERNMLDGGVPRLVDSQTVLVGEGEAIAPVTFHHRQDRVGRFAYRVEVPAQESESVTDDNRRRVQVNVVEARTRVLLVAGGPSWDYRFVARLFERDESIELSCWLQSGDADAVRDGDTVIDQLPASAEELSEYDIVILMDPDRAGFDEQWCRSVDTLVTEHGGGLLLAAARAHTPAFLREPVLQSLHDLLPVTLDPEADLILNKIGHYQLSPSPVEIPAAAAGHPIMQLADDTAAAMPTWPTIGEVYWHYPVLREKPAATVLMRHGNPRMRNSYGGHVLAAVQYVGAGRTGFLAFDGTWRWRRYGEGVYNRFWVQLVRYLAEGKLLQDPRRGVLLTERGEYSLGETVTVTARLLDERHEPLTDETVGGSYAVEGEKADFVMRAQPDRPGWFEGRFIPDRIGTYHLTLRMPGHIADEGMEIVHDVTVARPDLEMLRPQLDRPALVTLAEKSAGGRYFEVDEISELPGLIPDRHEELAVRSRPAALWDNGHVLALLIVLLCGEWALRKWSHLL